PTPPLRPAAAPALVSEALAWVVLPNLDGALERLSVQVGSPGGAADAVGARDALLEKLGASPAMARALDTRRPVAVACPDPRRGKSESLVIGLPVKSQAAFRTAIAENRPELPAGKHRVYGTGKDKMFVDFSGGPGNEVAYLSFDPTVADGAVDLMAGISRLGG